MIYTAQVHKFHSLEHISNRKNSRTVTGRKARGKETTRKTETQVDI
jgi:hypothetical protein